MAAVDQGLGTRDKKAMNMSVHLDGRTHPRILLRLAGAALLALLFSDCATRIRKGRPVSETFQERHEPLPSDRRAADAVAQKELMDLHFSSEGRGMHLAPGYLRQYHAAAWTGLPDLIVRDRWGFNIADGRVAGLHDVHYKNMTVGAAGCAACHSGKAAGRFYPGLGNKNFDVTQLGTDLARGQSNYAAVTPFRGEKREVEQSAIRFAETVGNPVVGNLTQGMVPVSLIFGWFYRQAEQEQPPTRGAVKVPALWGYATKAPAGLFCDGFGVSHPPGWAVAVELTAGQTPETVRAYLPAVERAEECLASLLPAPYPFAVDQDTARRGAQLFAQNCRECHGSYARDKDGLPMLKSPKWISWEKVGTDTDRLALVTDQFLQLAGHSPINDLIKVDPVRRHGYFAPRLEGIWARFPYLHNGSVPNMRALLSVPQERPRAFSLKRAGERERFDETLLGLTVPDAREEASLLKRGAAGERGVYDTRRLGHSNSGHEFGADLSESDKAALIEYLKTL